MCDSPTCDSKAIGDPSFCILDYSCSANRTMGHGRFKTDYGWTPLGQKRTPEYRTISGHPAKWQVPLWNLAEIDKLWILGMDGLEMSGSHVVLHRPLCTVLYSSNIHKKSQSLTKPKYSALDPFLKSKYDRHSLACTNDRKMWYNSPQVNFPPITTVPTRRLLSVASRFSLGLSTTGRLTACSKFPWLVLTWSLETRPRCKAMKAIPYCVHFLKSSRNS